ncbi:MAG: tRNA (adenosine(37)-N6)-dimethylallyltransferase MiaA, partial [Actinomycetota bacterium]
ASGKSAVAMAAARSMAERGVGVDLVSIDSMQVYRGMDIGTAKPSAAERRAVPHHCIDLVEATEEFTVADFRAAYAEALDRIARTGRRAVLVGGTGLYHRVVVDDFDLPGEYPVVRHELERESDTEALYRRLVELDPAAASKMEPANRRRVVRALEVTLGAGRAFSSFGPGVDHYPDTPVAQLGIRWPRDVLADRIERRVHEMVAAGLVAEVGALAHRGLSRSAGQALGYKEILEYLESRISQDEAVEQIITRTRQFAVRQERWFRRDPRVRWVDVEADPVAECVPTVVDLLENATT